MFYLPPQQKNLIKKYYQIYAQKLLKFHFDRYIKTKFSSKRSRYALAALLDIACIVLIAVNGAKPAERILTHLVSPWANLYSNAQIKSTKEVFSFAPGSSKGKFDSIDFNNLSILSFFDLPLDDDGTINFESRGYSSFKSQETLDLIDKAHSYNTKFLITVSAWNPQIIGSVLDSAEAQDNLISQVLAEVSESNIEGVSVDFEPKTPFSSADKEKYAQFLTKFKTKLHQQRGDGILAVVVPSGQKDNYDLKSLNSSTDRVLMMASDFIVPEVAGGVFKPPVYGFKDEDYWKSIQTALGSFTKSINQDSLVMERAWYGNGDNYPLYKPTSKPVEGTEVEPAHVFLDSEMVNRLASSVPQKARNAARKNIPLIGKALQDEGILDSNVLAYALATIEHETDGTFEPLEEIQGRFSARRLGYEGGTNYFGRGFIQLTHLRNYRMVGERIGMGEELAKHPELAGQPETAAKILAAFFKDNNIANLASQGYFVAARNPVNPDYNGGKIAMLAWKYWEDTDY